ncbi:MAG: hypothetical protein J0H41_01560 [Rhizobiales bacterium]|nr:hypothetical protein [Hyphomicrobiales bacterium]
MLRAVTPLRLIFAIAALAAASPAHAQQKPRAIADCEKIEAWDAYNKCLASFGPKRVGPARVTPGDGPAQGRTARARSRAPQGVQAMGRRNGRPFAVFDVGAPVKPARTKQR